MGKNHQPDYKDRDYGSTDSLEDKGSPTAVSRTCQHIKKSVDSLKLRKHLNSIGLLADCNQCQKFLANTPPHEFDGPDSPCSFEYDNTLWLCLKCGTQLCGRSRNQHALLHYKTPHSDSHALTMNTRTFEIWCYECDTEISADARRNLLECVEFVKSMALKQEKMASSHNAENKIVATWENIKPLLKNDEKTALSNSNENGSTGKSMPLILPPPPPIPGMAKRVNDSNNCNNTFSANSIRLEPINTNTINNMNNISNSSNYLSLEERSHNTTINQLPRVRGLCNLGNTCFFNAVMQCLAQTPYLLDVLKESSAPGEEFTLPGGTFKLNGSEVPLPPIKGTLSAWGALTSALAQTLEELQSGGGLFKPDKLFQKLCTKCPQFEGGDQHDSHELLRHLLESVRSEDLKRYQRVILQNLGYKDQDINTVSDDMKQKCKTYGNQAADRILRPDQVFRGFLVSTLTCQECFNVSSRHEYFLDLSLPVSVEKSPPPQLRRKPSPDNVASYYFQSAPPTSLYATTNSASTTKIGTDEITSTTTSPLNNNNADQLPINNLLKKEQKKERRVRIGIKSFQGSNSRYKEYYDNTGVGAAGDAASASHLSQESGSHEDDGPISAISSGSSSSIEQSDADIEDNLIEEGDKAFNSNNYNNNHLMCKTNINSNIDTNSNINNCDSNGNDNDKPSQLFSPVEKRDDSPENIDKDSLDEDENGNSGIATSPANAVNSFPASSNSNSETNGDTTVTNSVMSLGLSERGVNLVKQMSERTNNINSEYLMNGEARMSGGGTVDVVTQAAAQLLDQLQVSNEEQQQQQQKQRQLQQQHQQQQHQQQQQKKSSRGKMKRVRTQSYSDWSTTIAPRYQCEDGECSIQSCLNNFTAVELMTGNNKVGCENCTKRLNGDDPKAKTVNTNATKQFLISSPPAVLILHLKRFQLGPRCMFRKLTRPVNFPMILDIAPFCGSKVKTLPNIDRKQKKLLYALYGVVEHSGGMYGGHYTAYVKVRPQLTSDDKRWKFIPQGSKAELDQDDEQRKKLEELLAREKARDLRLKAANDSDDFSNSCSSSTDSTNTTISTSDQEDDDDDRHQQQHSSHQSTTQHIYEGEATGGFDEASSVQMPLGKWYHVSDSHVQEVNESLVLSAQAYLLFYERIY